MGLLRDLLRLEPVAGIHGRHSTGIIGARQSRHRIYNERLSAYDYREPCYRYLIVVATDPKLDLDDLVHTLKGPCETPAAVAETEGVLVQAFRAAENRAGDELRLRAKEIETLRHDLQWAPREIEHLNSTIRRHSEGRWKRLVKRLQALLRPETR
jgi:hypothetical protein